LLGEAHGTMPSAVKRGIKNAETYREKPCTFLIFNIKNQKKEEFICQLKD